MEMHWLIVVLFFLAVHRVTRLITADTFPPIAWARNIITRKKHDDHWLVYLFGSSRDTGCPWCMSLWAGGAGAAAFAIWTHWFWWPVWILIWLAASTVTGFLAQHEK